MNDPHANAQVFTAGAELEDATAAMILLHGRGAPAQDILGIAHFLEQPGLIFLAPQAQGFTWYPNSFMAPLASNQPWLDSALVLVDRLAEHMLRHGIPQERILLGGFSQGACLTLEYAARHPRRYGGIAAFSGGLIGPPEYDLAHAGSLAGTPVFLGCSDVDPHIPLERVQASTQALTAMGAEVTERIYPGMGHTINEDELNMVGEMVAKAVN